jgi:hypothetical protein
MLSSTVLEVAVGLVFCFASLTLVASSIYEAIASLFKLRAGALLTGVKALLNDADLEGLARDIYAHALVNPIGQGADDPGQKPKVRPSYIEPALFATALVESVQKEAGTYTGFQAAIDDLPDPQMRQLLTGMLLRAQGNLEDVRAQLAAWFDAGMERVSGTYKRKSQLFTFLIAFGLAGLFNVDTFHLFDSLWTHPALVAELASTAPGTAQDAVEALNTLPVGWATYPPSIPIAVLGWLVTASSALFGAPFWFDLLKRLVNLRGTGRKPGGKVKN